MLQNVKVRDSIVVHFSEAYWWVIEIHFNILQLLLSSLFI